MARPRHATKGSFSSRVITFAMLLVVLIYPFYEARHLKIEHKIITIDGLPQDLNNIKIVYLSDIHMGALYPLSSVQSLVQQVNALHADIVLLGGDYDGTSEGAINFFKEAPPFRARLLVAGVPGNHDRTLPESNLNLLQNAMIGANVWPLVNQTKSVKIGNANLVLAGIDDYHNGHPDIEGLASMVSAEDFVVFLSHSPAALPQAHQAVDRNGKPRWFDLALCGHTHGGQITFFGKPIFSEFQKVPARYLSGWIEENRVPILTSNGVGTVYVPIRMFAPPQIHVITLKSR